MGGNQIEHAAQYSFAGNPRNVPLAAEWFLATAEISRLVGLYRSRAKQSRFSAASSRKSRVFPLNVGRSEAIVTVCRFALKDHFN
jgi:hypothetical protein